MLSKDANVIVIKIGTSTLLGSDRTLDMNIVESLADDVAELWKKGKKIAIVTSGAVGLGKRGENGDARTAAMRGQPLLMHIYYEQFQRHGIEIGQLLLTNEQFANSEGIGNVVGAITRAFNEGTVVIINENDPISTEKTTMGDNDALAARVTCEINADALIMMSMKNGTPGKGGGDAKMKAICEVESKGITAIVVDGKEEHVISKIFRGDTSWMKNIEDIKSAARKDQQDKVKI
jgi:glutamate 5-kinase